MNFIGKEDVFIVKERNAVPFISGFFFPLGLFFKKIIITTIQTLENIMGMWSPLINYATECHCKSVSDIRASKLIVPTRVCCEFNKTYQNIIRD